MELVLELGRVVVVVFSWGWNSSCEELRLEFELGRFEFGVVFGIRVK